MSGIIIIKHFYLSRWNSYLLIRVSDALRYEKVNSRRNEKKRSFEGHFHDDLIKIPKFQNHKINDVFFEKNSNFFKKFPKSKIWMKILKIPKSQSNWSLFDQSFSISKKFMYFSFEIPNKSKNTYKTNEKSTCLEESLFWEKIQKHKRNDVLIMIEKFIRITRALVLFW